MAFSDASKADERAAHGDVRYQAFQTMIPLCYAHAVVESFRWALTVLTIAASCGCGDGESHPPEIHKDPGSIEIVATATYVKCPRIDSYTISPALNVAGLDVTLVASVSSIEEVEPSFLWTASSGTLRGAEASMAVYRCGEESSPTVTLTVYAADCRDSTTLVIDCT